MPDVNIAKFNIPIKIKRAFDKGKIADSYEEMYMMADKLASIETQRRYPQKTGGSPGKFSDPDLIVKGFVPLIDKDKRSFRKTQIQILDYRNERIDFHMNNMIKMLELYVTSRETK